MLASVFVTKKWHSKGTKFLQFSYYFVALLLPYNIICWTWILAYKSHVNYITSLLFQARKWNGSWLIILVKENFLDIDRLFQKMLKNAQCIVEFSNRCKKNKVKCSKFFNKTISQILESETDHKHVYRNMFIGWVPFQLLHVAIPSRPTTTKT